MNAGLASDLKPMAVRLERRLLHPGVIGPIRLAIGNGLPRRPAGVLRAFVRAPGSWPMLVFLRWAWPREPADHSAAFAPWTADRPAGSQPRIPSQLFSGARALMRLASIRRRVDPFHLLPRSRLLAPTVAAPSCPIDQSAPTPVETALRSPSTEQPEPSPLMPSPHPLESGWMVEPTPAIPLPVEARSAPATSSAYEPQPVGMESSSEPLLRPDRSPVESGATESVAVSTITRTRVAAIGPLARQPYGVATPFPVRRFKPRREMHPIQTARERLGAWPNHPSRHLLLVRVLAHAEAARQQAAAADRVMRRAHLRETPTRPIESPESERRSVNLPSCLPSVESVPAAPPADPKVLSRETIDAMVSTPSISGESRPDPALPRISAVPPMATSRVLTCGEHSALARTAAAEIPPQQRFDSALGIQKQTAESITRTPASASVAALLREQQARDSVGLLPLSRLSVSATSSLTALGPAVGSRPPALDRSRAEETPSHTFVATRHDLAKSPTARSHTSTPILSQLRKQTLDFAEALPRASRSTGESLPLSYQLDRTSVSQAEPIVQTSGVTKQEDSVNTPARPATSIHSGELQAAQATLRTFPARGQLLSLRAAKPYDPEAKSAPAPRSADMQRAARNFGSTILRRRSDVSPDGSASVRPPLQSTPLTLHRLPESVRARTTNTPLSPASGHPSEISADPAQVSAPSSSPIHTPAFAGSSHAIALPRSLAEVGADLTTKRNPSARPLLFRRASGPDGQQRQVTAGSFSPVTRVDPVFNLLRRTTGFDAHWIPRSVCGVIQLDRVSVLREWAAPDALWLSGRVPAAARLDRASLLANTLPRAVPERATTPDAHWHPDWGRLDRASLLADRLPRAVPELAARRQPANSTSTVFRGISPAFAPVALPVQRSSLGAAAIPTFEILPFAYPRADAAASNGLSSSAEPGWPPGSSRSPDGGQLSPIVSRTAALQAGAPASGKTEIARAPALPTSPPLHAGQQPSRATASPPGVRSASNPEDLAETVLRLVLDRLAVESERRGWQQWS
jgi:hypothetical protein